MHACRKCDGVIAKIRSERALAVANEGGRDRQPMAEIRVPVLIRKVRRVLRQSVRCFP
jgi:hypothetical protein